jgi:hypothetical protein
MWEKSNLLALQLGLTLLRVWRHSYALGRLGIAVIVRSSVTPNLDMSIAYVDRTSNGCPTLIASHLLSVPLQMYILLSGSPAASFERAA